MHGFPYLSVLTLAAARRRGGRGVGAAGQDATGEGVALFWSLVVLGFAIAMWVAFQASGPRFQFRESYPWIPFWGARFTLQADGIALVMLLLIAILVPLVILASWHDAEPSQAERTGVLRAAAGA